MTDFERSLINKINKYIVRRLGVLDYPSLEILFQFFEGINCRRIQHSPHPI